MNNRITGDNGFSDETCIVTDDVVNYSVNLEYPGARKWFAIKYTNKGSIDAKFEGMFDSFPSLNSTVKTYNAITNEVIKTEENNEYFFSFYKDSLLLGNADDTIISPSFLTESEQSNWVDMTNGHFLLKVDTSWHLFYMVEWPRNGYSEDGVYYEAKATAQIPFVQYNE